MLAAPVTSSEEAYALTYGLDLNDIYNCSWGPADDGMTLEGPDIEVLNAFLTGILHGRRGLGSIYLFAAGNGGISDNCNMDGFANSPLTLTIGAITWKDEFPKYMEHCPAMIGVTYSSDAVRMIATTDPDNRCTLRHGGTSAAAPIAAGILSLILSVRPDLHWRDIQELCYQCMMPLAGQNHTLPKLHSDKFGFGKFDTEVMLEKAEKWENIGPAVFLEMPNVHVNASIPFSLVGLQTESNISEEIFQNIWKESKEIYYSDKGSIDANLPKDFKLEHVLVRVNLKHPARGEIQVVLESPSGTSCILLTSRPKDTMSRDNSEGNEWEYGKSGYGLKNWHLSTVAFWRENPIGSWKLTVIDDINKDVSGDLISWNLIFLGEITSLKEKTSTLDKEGFRHQTVDIYFPENVQRQKRRNMTNFESHKLSPLSSDRQRVLLVYLLVGCVFFLAIGTIFSFSRMRTRSRNKNFRQLDSALPVKPSGSPGASLNENICFFKPEYAVS
jgi:kexin